MSTEVKKDKLIFEIIEKLQEVDPKEWENYVNVKLEFPSNAVSKKKYKGINIISIILFDMLPRHRTVFKYATFKQISARNGNETVLHILDTRQLRHAKGYCQLDADKMERAGTLTAS